MSARYRILIVLALASTVGLAALQIHWLRGALGALQDDFDQRVDSALGQVWNRIDPGDPLMNEILAITSTAAVDRQRITATLQELDGKVRGELTSKGVNEPFEMVLYRDGTELRYTHPPQAKLDRPRFTLSLDRACEGCGIRLDLKFPSTRTTAMLGRVPALAVLTFVLLTVLLTAFVLTVHGSWRLQQRALRQRAFVDNFAHEAKTPLFAMSVALRILSEHPRALQDSRRTQAVQSIRNSLNRLQANVERLLDLATLESGNVVFSKTPGNVHELVRSVADELRPLIQEGGGDIEIDLNATDTTIDLDSARLGEALRNLVDNARKYTEGTPRVRIRTFDVPEGICVAVEDRGIGIPARERKRIFERFYRVPTGDRHDVKGFGLGLTLAREVVEWHAGTIKVAPRQGGGSCFLVVLPRHQNGGTS